MKHTDDTCYQKTEMEKSVILDRLRSKGFRITKQREVLLEVILESNCTCCKEVYFHALKKDPKIGLATIYRMINLLEEIGVLQTRNEYQICAAESARICSCVVELENDKIIMLDQEKLYQALSRGMELCGFTQGESVKYVVPSENVVEKISQQEENG